MLKKVYAFINGTEKVTTEGLVSKSDDWGVSAKYQVPYLKKNNHILKKNQSYESLQWDYVEIKSMNEFKKGLNIFIKDLLILVERGSPVTSFSTGNVRKQKTKWC